MLATLSVSVNRFVDVSTPPLRMPPLSCTRNVTVPLPLALLAGTNRRPLPAIAAAEIVEPVVTGLPLSSSVPRLAGGSEAIRTLARLLLAGASVGSNVVSVPEAKSVVWSVTAVLRWSRRCWSRRLAGR